VTRRKLLHQIPAAELAKGSPTPKIDSTLLLLSTIIYRTQIRGGFDPNFAWKNSRSELAPCRKAMTVRQKIIY
jgi:hypothetical protein